jgi:hypothetical protein
MTDQRAPRTPATSASNRNRRSRRPSPFALLQAIEPRILFSVAGIEPLNGWGNNVMRPWWGSEGTDLIRTARAAYADGLSSPSGANRPSARAISNAISAQTGDLVNNRHLSDMVYLFGQFLDHDLDLTTTGTDPMNIAVPTGDPSFDPNSTGTQVIPDTRSNYDPNTGTTNPRQQINSITSFIDGSQIYGSDQARENALRTFSGGHLKTSAGNLLPYNTAGLDNANDAHIVPDDQLFLAGDIRANENIELTSIQTLFMREHNRLADQFAAQHPDWSDEQLFQAARRVVIAELQAITFNEFLPALLGSQAPGPYQGYNPNVNPTISTEFSTAAFRFGHSMLDEEVGRVNNDGSDYTGGELSLAQAFFNPTLLDTTKPNHEGDIDPILLGAASGNAQEIDVHVVDALRNFLFGPPGSGGLDLASLNIQRGRDHGLPDYNTLRAAYGLPKVTSFSQITSDTQLASELQSTYGSVNNIDAWVGGLAEDHVPGSSLGPTFGRIIADQFSRLRAGDRFWYQNTMSGPEVDMINHTKLSDIIKRNTSITNIQSNVMLYYEPGTQPAPTPPPAPKPAPAPAPKPATQPTTQPTTQWTSTQLTAARAAAAKAAAARLAAARAAAARALATRLAAQRLAAQRLAAARQAAAAATAKLSGTPTNATTPSLATSHVQPAQPPQPSLTVNGANVLTLT